MIDIVTPAIVRPVIYERMIKSFREFMFTNEADYRYIINIDPFGEKTSSVQDIADIARKYFPNAIIHIAERPSFANAVKYLWSQVQSDYFFYIEDDWQLHRFVDVQVLLDIARKYPTFGAMCFRYYGNHASYPKKLNCVCDYEELSNFIGFIPSLISKDFGHSAVPYFIDDSCPELQVIKNFLSSKEAKSKNYKYLRYGKLDGCMYLTDIGRKWKSFYKISKSVRIGKPFKYNYQTSLIGVLDVH